MVFALHLISLPKTDRFINQNRIIHYCMKVKLLFILSALAISLLTSCAYEQPIPQSPKIYLVDEQGSVEMTALEKPKAFVVVEEDDFVLLQEENEKRSELNKIRALRDFEDEQEEFDFESKYSNVRRIIDDELVVGYKKELDNPDFKEVE